MIFVKKNMNKRNCIIVHGCFPQAEEVMNHNASLYDAYWASWIQKELEKRNIKISVPKMPYPKTPQYELFKAEFEKLFLDEYTVLIGHSCGCAFLTRWLGETKKKVAKLIFVGPWNVAKEDDAIRKAFYAYDIDTSIPQRISELVMFTSDNESNPGKKSLRMFHEALGGEIIDLPQKGHYLIDDMGTAEFPELLEVILR